jgi:hypothetical protein
MVARCDFTNYTGTNVIVLILFLYIVVIFTIIVLHLQLSGQLEQILKDDFSDSSNMFDLSNNSK